MRSPDSAHPGDLGPTASGTAALGPFPSISDMGRGHSPRHGKAPEFIPELSCAFSAPRCCRLPISWLQEEVPLGSTAQSHPTWGEVGRRVEGSACASGVPQDPSARQPPPAGTSRASGLPALLLFPLRLPRQEPLWPVKLSVPLGSCTHHGQPGPLGQVAAGLGQPGQLSPPALSPGWPGAPSSPCMNVYFIRTDADHGI